MTAERTNDSLRTTLGAPIRLVRRLWRDLLSVYCANTPAWRWLKSGTLVFFGFFLWAASNLLLSNVPDWTWLTYPMAYGFVLLVWGPLTHMVVVPAIIRGRRVATHPVFRRLVRHGSKLNFGLFLAIVLVLGTYPVGPMTLDFQGAIAVDGTGDVNPDYDCTLADGEVTCQVEHEDGMGSVVVTSDRERIADDDEQPYELTFGVDELAESPSTEQKQFTIEIRDDEGTTVRRFVVPLSAVEE